MNKKQKCFSLIACVLGTMNASAQAMPTDPTPHFYVQMENSSNQNATISFQQVQGNVSLTPELSSHTSLPAHQQSQKYGVVFNPIGKDDTFNIVFTGKQDCFFNVAFYGVNNPKITVAGPGCFGGGYRLDRDTLVLFISDIHRN